MLTITDSETGIEYEVVGTRCTKNGDTFISLLDNCIMVAKGGGDNPIRTILKPIKWRAKEGEQYYIVHNSYGARILLQYEECTLPHRTQHESGNYYRTEEEAQAVADKFNNIFKEGG